MILKDYYEGYENALKLLKLEKLNNRRERLCLDFAKKCLRNNKVQSMFPVNKKKRLLRNNSKYLVKFASTERYRKSAIPFMQNLLNENEIVKQKLIRYKGL